MMSNKRYASSIQRARVPLRVRRVGENCYRTTDAAGRGLQYLKKGDFTADALRAAEEANGKEIFLEGCFSRRTGRWSIIGRLYGNNHQALNGIATLAGQPAS